MLNTVILHKKHLELKGFEKLATGSAGFISLIPDDNGKTKGIAIYPKAMIPKGLPTMSEFQIKTDGEKKVIEDPILTERISVELQLESGSEIDFIFIPNGSYIQMSKGEVS